MKLNLEMNLPVQIGIQNAPYICILRTFLRGKNLNRNLTSHGIIKIFLEFFFFLKVEKNVKKT